MTFRQPALSGAPSQSASGDCTLIRRPPTSCLSFSHFAADGHAKSAGRTRRISAPAKAACIDVGRNRQMMDSRGIAARRLRKLLLFIPCHRALAIRTEPILLLENRNARKRSAGLPNSKLAKKTLIRENSKRSEDRFHDASARKGMVQALALLPTAREHHKQLKNSAKWLSQNASFPIRRRHSR